MTTMSGQLQPFHVRRRQQFADEAAFAFTDSFAKASWFPELKTWIEDRSLSVDMRAEYAETYADKQFEALCRQFTSGAALEALGPELGTVVAAYQRAAALEREHKQDAAAPLFDFSLIDHYSRALSLLSLAVLLHREDLIPAVHSLFEGGEPDGSDALIEDLLSKFLPDRPYLDVWYHDEPYRHLLDVTADTPMTEKQDDMKKFLKAWYKGMRGAGWFDSHKAQSARGTAGYFGYWAFEAAAIAYLYELDDREFRDHMVYPKDLADYARSVPRRTVGEAKAQQQKRLRCEAGQPCPQEGYWFTPAQQNSRRFFKVGELMPDVGGDYGATIWQWDRNQD